MQKILAIVFSITILLTFQCCMLDEKVTNGEERLTSDNIETKWATKIDNKCKHTYPCRITIKELTDFTWDRMVIVLYEMDHEELNKVLGIYFPNNIGMTRKIIFLKDNKIVYSEQPPTSIEKIIPGEIVFDSARTGPYRIYTPDTAIFKVTEKQSGEGIYYEMIQSREE